MTKLALLSRNRVSRRQKRINDPEQTPRSGLQVGELRRLPNVLGQAALLEWLGQAPISFNRAYVGLAGGVLQALWLSAAMERVANAKAHEFEANGDFVFSMSETECEAAIGLIRSQQHKCRRDLVASGLLSVTSLPPAPPVYRLHLDCLARKLLAQSAPLAEHLAAYEPLPELPAAWERQA